MASRSMAIEPCSGVSPAGRVGCPLTRQRALNITQRALSFTPQSPSVTHRGRSHPRVQLPLVCLRRVVSLRRRRPRVRRVGVVRRRQLLLLQLVVAVVEAARAARRPRLLRHKNGRPNNFLTKS